MSEGEEDFDGLPPIKVNSSARNSRAFLMPSADVLASQRAREEQCERELRLLREEHAVARVTNSDSSGSEGEAALAAAVTALRVRQREPCAVTLRAAVLLHALAPHLPRPPAAFLAAYLDALQRADAAAAVALTEHVSQSVCELVRGAAADGGRSEGEAESVDAWSGAESVGAWLGAASVWDEPRVMRVPVRRALHLLLDDVASTSQVDALGRAFAVAFQDARLRLELSDALRSGGGGGADRLARRLLWAALEDAPTLQYLPRSWDSEIGDGLRPELSESVVARWRRVDADAQYTLLQAAGRALAAGARPGTLLAALAQPPPALDAHRPDRLKVLVAASKLQVLFHGGR